MASDDAWSTGQGLFTELPRKGEFSEVCGSNLHHSSGGSGRRGGAMRVSKPEKARALALFVAKICNTRMQDVASELPENSD
jgi:hypothetical protein